MATPQGVRNQLETINESKMNGRLNKEFHGLLTSTGMAPQKATLVAAFTNGRSESSKDLNDYEAIELIKYLKGQKPGTDDASQKMRRKMISLAHELHWHVPGTGKVDMERLNNWCRSPGKYKKELNAHNYTELVSLVSQFKIVHQKFLNKL